MPYGILNPELADAEGAWVGGLSRRSRGSAPNAIRIPLSEVNCPTLLVQAGARPDPEWLDANAEWRNLAEKIRSDMRMQTALRGEMPQ